MKRFTFPFNTNTLLLLSILAVTASVHVLPFPPIVAYAGTKILASLLFLIFAVRSLRTSLESSTVWTAIVLFVLLRLSFVGTAPIGSDDIFRYLWDGRVQSAGIDPYLYAPDSPQLNGLHTADLPQRVNQPQMPTLYFPLSEWIFLGAYHLSGTSFLGYKILLFLAEILLAFVLLGILRRMNSDPKFALLFFACPLMIYEYSIDAHVDLFGLLFLALFLLFHLDRKTFLALFFLGCSVSVKPAALVLLPVLFFYHREWKERLLTLAVPFAVVAVQFLPYIGDGDIFVSLRTFARHWTFNGFFFHLFDLWFRDNLPSRLASTGLMVLLLAVILFRKDSLTGKMYNAMLVLLLCSPIVHPWYIGWVALFVPLVQRPSGLYFIAAAGLTVLTPLTYQLTGAWVDYWPVLLVEYLPVLYLLQAEWRGIPAWPFTQTTLSPHQ